MTIEEAVKNATQAPAERRPGFEEQLQKNRDFQVRMQEAGVVPKRRGFTIPLMERIALQR